MAAGPCSTRLRNAATASGSLSASDANSTAPTSAVPAAAPMERESWTEAAAEPSEPGPAAFCTVTWTTPMTVPMQRPITNRNVASGHPLRLSAHRAKTVSARVANTSPTEGNIAVSPVRLTLRPVIMEPAPMPNISGSSNRPVSEAELPRTTRR